MCEYCDGIFRSKKLMVYCREFHEDEWAIILSDYDSNTRLIYCGIKFCPMCGRQLVENIPKGNTFSVDNI